MKTRTVKLLVGSISIAVVAVAGIWLLNWLNRPLLVSLDDPDTQPIKNVITRSHEIDHRLFSDPESDVELLKEVYIDTEGYKLSKNSNLWC